MKIQKVLSINANVWNENPKWKPNISFPWQLIDSSDEPPFSRCQLICIFFGCENEMHKHFHCALDEWRTDNSYTWHWNMSGKHLNRWECFWTTAGVGLIKEICLKMEFALDCAIEFISNESFRMYVDTIDRTNGNKNQKPSWMDEAVQCVPVDERLRNYFNHFSHWFTDFFSLLMENVCTTLIS